MVEPEENEPLTVAEPAQSDEKPDFNPPTRLIRISSEDLEHFEDKKLDAAYESHLERLGDDLRPLPGVRNLLDSQSEEEEPRAEDSKELDTSNRAIDIAMSMGSDDDEETSEPIELSKEPTEEELIEYAGQHPSVRPILKLFRGKITSVKKLDDSVN